MTGKEPKLHFAFDHPNSLMFYIFSAFGKFVYQTKFKLLIWLKREVEGLKSKVYWKYRLTYKNKPRGEGAGRGWEGGKKGKSNGRREEREERLFLLSQKFFQCSVYLMYSSLLSVHFWSLHFVAFFRTNRSTRPALLPRNKSDTNPNASNLPLLWFLHGPIFSGFLWTGFGVFLNCSQGQVELSSKSLCGFVASWFLSAANPRPRLQFFRSRKTNRVAQAVSVHPWRRGLQTIVLSVSLSAAILQDSLPSAPRFPRFPQMKPQCASPPAVVRLRMPEAEWILVGTDLAEPDRSALPAHTQAVQPSYSWAKLSRLVASLITKSTY